MDSFLKKPVYGKFVMWHLILIIIISLSIGLGVGLSNNSETSDASQSSIVDSEPDVTQPVITSPVITLSPEEQAEQDRIRYCNELFRNNKIVVNNDEGSDLNIKTMINKWYNMEKCFKTRDGFNKNGSINFNFLVSPDDFRHISNWDTSNVTDMSNLFEDAYMYHDINTKISKSKNGQVFKAWDTSNVTNMSGMFKNSKLHFRIDKWDTSNVTDMSNMFEGSDFNNIFSENKVTFDEMDSYTCWNTSNIRNMSKMFKNSDFNNASINNLQFESVTDMSNMFEDAKFNQLITFNIRTNVNMNEMFLNSVYNKDLTSIKEKLENPDKNITWVNILTGSPAYNRSGNEFIKIFKVTDENIKREVDEYYNETSIIYTKEIKSDESHYKNICNWDTSEVTDMSGLFERKAMTQVIGVPASENRYVLGSSDKQFNFWDTSNVTNMEKMFYNTNVSVIFRGDDDIPQIRNLYLRPRKVRRKDGHNYVAWDTSNVTNMKEMFRSCKSIREFFASTAHYFRVSNPEDYFHLKLDVSGLITSNVTNMGFMFNDYKPHIYPTSGFNQNVNTKVVRYEETDNDEPTSGITTSSTNGTTTSSTIEDDVPIPGVSYLAWDTSNVTNIGGMFSGQLDFNKEIGNWNTSNVTNMMSMFDNCSNFNKNIGNWDTSNVTTMRSMFAGAKLFDKNIGNWDTSKVTTMRSMFNSCKDFHQDINTKEVTVNGKTYTAWDVSKVTSMSLMFRYSDTFNQDIGNWDTSNVTDMWYMFHSVDNFDKDINTKEVTVNGKTYMAWNVSKVTSMSRMFEGAKKFNKPLNNWNITIKDGSNMSAMFYGANNFNQDLKSWNICYDESRPLFHERFRLTIPGSEGDIGREKALIKYMFLENSGSMDFENNISKDCTIRTRTAIAGFTTSSIASFTTTSTGTD